LRSRLNAVSALALSSLALLGCARQTQQVPGGRFDFRSDQPFTRPDDVISVALRPHPPELYVYCRVIQRGSVRLARETLPVERLPEQLETLGAGTGTTIRVTNCCGETRAVWERVRNTLSASGYSRATYEMPRK